MCIESQRDLQGLMHIGRVVALTLQTMQEKLEPGMTTKQLDDIGWKVLKQHGARPAPLLTYQFPGIACISVNDEAAHGIPGKRQLRPGDLVKIDVSAELGGYFADSAITVAIPPVAPIHRQLCTSALDALGTAMVAARAREPITAIGRAAERTVRASGFRVIRDLPGHGVGRALHEDPSVPMDFRRQATRRLDDGLVITVEPHISAGSSRLVTQLDGWTLSTRDGSFAAAFEHTIVVRQGQPVIVTEWV